MSAEASSLDALLDSLAERVAERVLEILDERQIVRSPTNGPQNALRMDEAGQRLGLSAREVQRQVLSGALHSVKVGRVRLIPLSALDQFLAERARAG